MLGEDSIEHYACCPHVRNFHEYFHISLRGTPLASFLGLGELGIEGEMNVRLISLYACYKVHGILSHNTYFPLDTFKLLKEAAVSAVLDDICNSTWLTHFTSNFNAPPPSAKQGYKRKPKRKAEESAKSSKHDTPTWQTNSTNSSIIVNAGYYQFS